MVGIQRSRTAVVRCIKFGVVSYKNSKLKIEKCGEESTFLMNERRSDECFNDMKRCLDEKQALQYSNSDKLFSY